MRKIIITTVMVCCINVGFGQTRSMRFSIMPKASEKRIEEGKKLIESGKLKKAKNKFKKALEEYDKAFEARSYLALVLSLEGNNEAAIAEFEEGIELFTEHKAHVIQQKEQSLRKLEMEQSEETRALDRMDYKGKNGDFYYNTQVQETKDAGMAGFGGGPSREELNPAAIATRNKSRGTYIEELKEDLKRDRDLPYPAFFRFKYGNALMAVKQHEKAKVQYEKALEVDPELVPNYVNLSVCYYLLGMTQKAHETFQLGKARGAKFHPDFERTMNGLGG